jgi:uncharacterized protein (DUF885 family)
LTPDILDAPIGHRRGAYERVRGAAFDIRDFHTAILEHGALPLRVLRAVVDSAAAGTPPLSVP